MNIETSFSEADKKELYNHLTQVVIETIQSMPLESIQKRALTIKEVAESISYKPGTVLSFIKEGRRDRKGHKRRLPARQITLGDYRILPEDLESWLLCF